VIPGFDPKHGFDPEKTQYVLIPPRELGRRIEEMHGAHDKLHMYLWVTGKNRCWETRGLRKKEKESIVHDHYTNSSLRDFSRYLNAWQYLEKLLR
jgi:hypothetical protein